MATWCLPPPMLLLRQLRAANMSAVRLGSFWTSTSTVASTARIASTTSMSPSLLATMSAVIFPGPWKFTSGSCFKSSLRQRSCALTLQAPTA